MRQQQVATPRESKHIPASVVTDIHAIATDALGEIHAITRLVLCALEHSDTYRRMEELGKVIECIHFAAGGAIDTLDGEMESLGIQIPEKAQDRRRTAYYTATTPSRS